MVLKMRAAEDKAIHMLTICTTKVKPKIPILIPWQLIPDPNEHESGSTWWDGEENADWSDV